MSTVLVVEDEREIRELLRRYLERAGHDVITAATGAEGQRHLEESLPDLLLLDLGLPDVDGLELLSFARVVSVPVIALTARSSVEDRIRGLEQGAGDYVTKPFSPHEVVLRVGAVLARSAAGAGSPDAPTTFDGGRLVVDRPARRAVWDGRELDLTPTEWGVLTTLSDHPGRVYTRAELVNRVRGYEYAGYERTIDTHVKNLRHKLGDDGASVVVTVLGAGYRLGIPRD